MNFELQAVSAEQADRLFWLGRYVDRVYSTLRIYNDFIDVMIDSDGMAYLDFCRRLSIDSDVYSGPTDFEHRYLFDSGIPDSIVSNLSRAYDNALVLRNFLTSETLSYIELSLNKLHEEAGTDSSYLETQPVCDWLLAFWGSVEETVSSGERRSLLMLGKYVERLDLQLRLDLPLDEVANTLSKFRRVVRESPGLHVAVQVQALQELLLTNPVLSPEDRARALDLANGLH